MSILDVRSAALKAAGDKIHFNRIDCTTPTVLSSRLEISGWIRDGLSKHGKPFGYETAPFEGDPAAKAAAIIDYILNPTKEEPVALFNKNEPTLPKAGNLDEPKRSPGGKPILNASERITKAFGRIATSVEGLAADAEAVAGSVEGTVAHGRAVIKDAADADRQLREGLGLPGDNGGPKGPLPGED